MVKKKLNRKQLLNEPDEFITQTSKIIQWCRKYPKQLTYGIGALLAVILILIGVKTLNDSRAKAASTLLGQGLSGIQTMNAQNTKDPSAAKTNFDQLLAGYGHQPAARLGRIIYAHFQLSEGSVDQAVELYQKALDDFEHDPSLAPIIYNGLASAYVKKQMTEQAIAYYEKITLGPGNLLKDSALFYLGRLYRQVGEIEKSDQAYGRLSAEFPQSNYTPVASEAKTS